MRSVRGLVGVLLLATLSGGCPASFQHGSHSRSAASSTGGTAFPRQTESNQASKSVVEGPKVQPGGVWTFPETEFRAWLDRVVKTERPPAPIVAFNLGLFETPTGYSAYLSGAEHYSAADGDWACDEKFTPKERYFALPGKFAQGTKDAWKSVRTIVSDAFRAYLMTPIGRASFFHKAKAVTVGFDDGDLLRVK